MYLVWLGLLPFSSTKAKNEMSDKKVVLYHITFAICRYIPNDPTDNEDPDQLRIRVPFLELFSYGD